MIIFLQWRMELLLVAICFASIVLQCTSGNGEGEFAAFAKQLEAFDYTCGMPLEEARTLDDSAAGKMITVRLFEQLQEIPPAVGQSCGAICDDIAKDQRENGGAMGGFFPTNDCIRACEKKAPQSVNRSIQLCAPKINRTVHCAHISYGHYCMVAKSKDGREECLVLDTETKEAKEFRCPGGFYCTGGPESPIVCTKGSSCREGAYKQHKCKNGEFCLQSGYPWKCDHRPEVQEDSANGGPPAQMLKLLEGTLCKRDDRGKIIVPLPCPAGSYCEEGRAKKCPSRHVCVLGSSSPTKCVFGELCTEGVSKPLRWPRAVGEFALNLLLSILAIVVPSGKCNFGRYGRVYNVVAGFVMLIIMWAYEFFRSDHAWYSHCCLITALFVFILYGGIIGPKLVSQVPFIRKLGPKSRLFVDWLVFMLALVFLWFVFGLLDQYTTLFFSLFCPCMLLCERVSGGVSVTKRTQALVSLVGAGFLFGVLYIIDPLVHHESTALLYLIIVGPEIGFYLMHRLKQTKDEKKKIQEIHDNYWVFHEQHHARFKDRDEEMEESLLHLTSSRDIAGAVELGTTPKKTKPEKAPLPELPPTWEDRPTPPEERKERRRTSLLRMFMKDSDVSMDDGGARGIGITLENMSLFLPHGEAILRDISLTIPAISTMAVMGPSGSGKSSIMNVLSGRAGYGMVTGKIVVNGDPDGISLEQLVNVTGFVPQDDVMHRKLTVLENITFQAKLRLPTYKRVDSNTWAHEMSAEVVAMMGLSHVSDSLIGDESERGISGGQRKRVSIGMEMVAKPSLLFLDEPTSGLDSTTSLEVIKIMAQESKKCNCTSVAVIHQPRYETLMIFDHVVLLAAGGYLVYAGPTSRVMDYFRAELGVPFPDKANPADVFMDAISLECAKDFAQNDKMAVTHDAFEDAHTFGQFLSSTWERRHAEYSNDPATAHVLVPNIAPQRGSWGESVIAQLERSTVLMKRNVGAQLTLSGLLSLGVLIVVIAIPPKKIDNIIAQPMFALFFLMLVQGVAAQRVFGGPERFVAWREAGVGFNMLIYFIGKDIAALAEIYFNSGIFALVYWPLCPLQCSYHTVFWCTFAFNYAVWGLSFIWSIATEPAVAQMLSVLASFVCFLLAGLQPTFVDLVSIQYGALVPTMAMSPIRYAFGFLMMDHACGTARTSEFKSPYIRFMSREALLKKGMPLDWVFDNEWSCTGRTDNPLGMESQWSGCLEDTTNPHCKPGEIRPPNGLMCTVCHMYLIGILFRFVALICLMVLCKKHGKGGHTVHGFGRLSRALFFGFVMIFVRVQVAAILLCQTQLSPFAIWLSGALKPWVNATEH